MLSAIIEIRNKEDKSILLESLLRDRQYYQEMKETASLSEDTLSLELAIQRINTLNRMLKIQLLDASFIEIRNLVFKKILSETRPLDFDEELSYKEIEDIISNNFNEDHEKYIETIKDVFKITKLKLASEPVKKKVSRIRTFINKRKKK